ncbi:hypothetical protein F4806DRAFT_426553 [Annulohypoxylon nitens]|nr:hypothetical protein F4806DRAFT_426553 [Annulohypoxylon nitens]
MGKETAIVFNAVFSFILPSCHIAIHVCILSSCHRGTVTIRTLVGFGLAICATNGRLGLDASQIPMGSATAKRTPSRSARA